MPLAPGTWLGQYEILSLLGVGGMGEVYHANDNKLNRETEKVEHSRGKRFPRKCSPFLPFVTTSDLLNFVTTSAL